MRYRRRLRKLVISICRPPAAFREALIKSARADSERFCFLRKFGESRNTPCISDFPNCTEGAKDPLLSRRRFIQRFLSCEGMTTAISDASEAIKTVRCDGENGELELPQQHPFLPHSCVCNRLSPSIFAGRKRKIEGDFIYAYRDNPAVRQIGVCRFAPSFLSLRDQCAHWSWQSPG